MWIISILSLTAALCRKPVVFVPGIGGSGLILGADKALVDACSIDDVQNFDNYRAWVSIQALRPPAHHQECWAAMMKLRWDNIDHVYRNMPGINVHPDSFGNLDGIAFLDYIEGVGLTPTTYFGNILTEFFEDGYREGVDVFGSGYDWRYPPWQLADYYSWLKQTIEFAHNKSNHKVTLISHSLGALVLQYFFHNKVSDEWKDAYVAKHIAIAPATGGSFKAIRALLSGYDDISMSILNFFHLTLVPELVLRDFLRGTGSTYALLPNTATFGEDFPVVIIDPYKGQVMDPQIGQGLKSYYNEDFDFEEDAEKFQFSALELSRKIWLKVYDRWNSGDVDLQVYSLKNWTLLLEPEVAGRAKQAALETYKWLLKDPGVPTIVFYSTFDKPTTQMSYVYPSTDFNVTSPYAIKGLGDDTLLRETTRDFHETFNSTVLTTEFKNQDHLGLLTNGAFARFLSTFMTGVLGPSLTDQVQKTKAQVVDSVSKIYGSVKKGVHAFNPMD